MYFFSYAKTKTLLTSYLLDMFGQLWHLLCMFHWILFHSAKSQIPQGPTLKCLPCFQSQIVYSFISYNIFKYTNVCIHPSILLLSVFRKTMYFHSRFVDPSFWMMLQLTVLFWMQDLHCQQDLPLTCSWCWCFVYHYSLSLMCYPVAQQHAKWDALKEQRSRLWSQAEVITNAFYASEAAIWCISH